MIIFISFLLVSINIIIIIINWFELLLFFIIIIKTIHYLVPKLLIQIFLCSQYREIFLTFPILLGVPQSSILGRLLLNIFMNDLMPKQIFFWISLFADKLKVSWSSTARIRYWLCTAVFHWKVYEN
jgi:hypothetical protein